MKSAEVGFIPLKPLLLWSQIFGLTTIYIKNGKIRVSSYLVYYRFLTAIFFGVFSIGTTAYNITFKVSFLDIITVVLVKLTNVTIIIGLFLISSTAYRFLVETYQKLSSIDEYIGYGLIDYRRTQRLTYVFLVVGHLLYVIVIIFDLSTVFENNLQAIYTESIVIYMGLYVNLLIIVHMVWTKIEIIQRCNILLQTTTDNNFRISKQAFNFLHKFNFDADEVAKYLVLLKLLFYYLQILCGLYKTIIYGNLGVVINWLYSILDLIVLVLVNAMLHNKFRCFAKCFEKILKASYPNRNCLFYLEQNFRSFDYMIIIFKVNWAFVFAMVANISSDIIMLLTFYRLYVK